MSQEPEYVRAIRFDLMAARLTNLRTEEIMCELYPGMTKDHPDYQKLQQNEWHHTYDLLKADLRKAFK